MQFKFVVFSAFVVLGVSGASGVFADAMHPMNLMSEKETRLNTNILSNNEAINKLMLDKGGLTFLNPSKILEEASPIVQEDDIEEDLNDRFITTGSGKSRPKTVDTNNEWADEEMVAKTKLRRTKRCIDDDGDAARARRGGRSRSVRRRNRRGRRARTTRREVPATQSATTTTITRKVIQNGQLVSETSQTGGLQQPVTVVQHQPGVVQHPPVVQVVPQQQATQPVVQVVPQQHTAQPVVVQHQPLQQVMFQPVGGTVTLPSASVQGAVKVS